jgi:hypothetical protein
LFEPGGAEKKGPDVSPAESDAIEYSIGLENDDEFPILLKVPLPPLLLPPAPTVTV